jgi:hypothetical protein
MPLINNGKKMAWKDATRIIREGHGDVKTWQLAYVDTIFYFSFLFLGAR